MQQNLPSPAIKRSTRVVSRSDLDPTSNKPLAETGNVKSQNSSRMQDERKVEAIRTLGQDTRLQVKEYEDEVVITLPTYALFKRGGYEIDPNSPATIAVTELYQALAKQLAGMTQYDIYFTGHTDAIPIADTSPGAPEDNMELGFRRAKGLFNYFFADALTDRTRITFASKGDNVPVIPNATLDSERLKNRRVVITLKKLKE
jgi:flagellar motor protein MotB